MDPIRFIRTSGIDVVQKHDLSAFFDNGNIVVSNSRQTVDHMG